MMDKINEAKDPSSVTSESPLTALATPRPWKVSWVRWAPDAPVMGFAIRPDNEQLLRAKRGVAIASVNCAGPHISAEAMYPNGEIEANAELIVQCVNSASVAEKLAGAAKVVSSHVSGTPDHVVIKADFFTALDSLRSAIAEYEKISKCETKR